MPLVFLYLSCCENQLCDSASEKKYPDLSLGKEFLVCLWLKMCFHAYFLDSDGFDTLRLNFQQ